MMSLSKTLSLLTMFWELQI